MRLSRHVAASAVCLSLAAPAAASAQTPEHTVSVVGRGQAELRPDRGQFVAAVQKRSATADAARGFVNRRLKRIVGGLRAVGVGSDRLTTSQVSLSRDRRRSRKDGPVRTTYRASAVLEVDVEGLQLLARAIDAASRRGATDVYGPQLTFTPERRSLVERRAEAVALEDARKRAVAAAAYTSQEIVDVQSIDLDPPSGGFSPFSLDSAGGSAGRSVDRTRIFAAKRTITSRARVTYVIQPSA